MSNESPNKTELVQNNNNNNVVSTANTSVDSHQIEAKLEMVINL